MANTIFRNLHDAAAWANWKQDYALEQTCDKLNVLLGDGMRLFNMDPTTENFQSLHALWTQAEIIISNIADPHGNKPKSAA